MADAAVLDRAPAAHAGVGALGRLLPWVALFVGAVIFLAWAIQPFTAGPVAFDGTASVLYFERIVHGQRLEAFVNTTPKPLLTFALGLAHGVTGDWRAVTWSTILITATGTVLGARLALRVAGVWAAVIAAVVIVGNRAMVVETGWSHGLPWAFACWTAAGLALTAARPRYATAGVFLMLGALARQETFLLIGMATALIVALALRRRLPSGASRLLIGWAALPVMLLHDLLLTGDPLWWLKVASINAAGQHTRPASVVAGMLLDIARNQPLTVAFGVLGVLAITRTAAGRITAIGITTIVFGTSALLLVLAKMQRQTLFYYLDPIIVTIGFAAALGAAAVGTFVGRAVAQRWAARGGRDSGRAERLEMAIGGAVSIALGVLVLLPIRATPSSLASTAARVGNAARSDDVSVLLKPLLPAQITAPPAPGAAHRADATAFRILVPGEDQARLAVDLKLPLTFIGPIVPKRPAEGMIHPGMLVYHDQIIDEPKKVSPAFEGRSPATVDGVTFDLVHADPGRIWVWKSTDWPPAP